MTKSKEEKTFFQKLKIFFSKNWVVISIFLIACFLRLFNVANLTTFGGDQGYDFLIVKKISTLQKFPLLGPKIGPYNDLGTVYLGPAYYYLLAPSLAISNLDPIGPAVFTAFLGALAVLIIFKIGSDYFSKITAIVASLFYATDTFLVIQSQAPSNPHLSPFFSVLVILGTLKIIKSKSKNLLWPALVGISLGILFQLHYLALSEAFVVFTALLIFQRKRLLQTFIFYLIALSPQILFELRHNFFITSQIIRQLTYGKTVSPAETFTNHILESVQMLGQVIIQNSTVSALILITITLVAASAVISNKQARAQSMLLVSIILSTIFFASIYASELNAHYLVIAYPALALIIGIAFARTLKRGNNFLLQSAAVFLILSFVFINIFSPKLISKTGYTMPTGWNLEGVRKAARLIAQDPSSQGDFNVAATLDGDTRAMPYRYLLDVYGKTPLGVENYPQSKVLYLVARDDIEAIKSYTVWEVSSLNPFSISKVSEIQNGITLYKLEKLNVENKTN